MSDAKQVFEIIANNNQWGDKESRSGAGSTLSYTTNLRQEILTFIRMFDIKTFFDAPCGDFNWMKEVAFPTDVSYLGGDIVKSLIGENSALYADSGRRFIEFDVVHDRFPECDVWFCRDCLFHLPNAMIFETLENFCKSEARLVMMTNHVNAVGFQNKDVEIGGFRRIDFHIAPFFLSRNVLFRAADYVHPHPQREMCVWSRTQVVEALNSKGYLPTKSDISIGIRRFASRVGRFARRAIHAVRAG